MNHSPVCRHKCGFAESGDRGKMSEITVAVISVVFDVAFQRRRLDSGVDGSASLFCPGTFLFLKHQMSMNKVNIIARPADTEVIIAHVVMQERLITTENMNPIMIGIIKYIKFNW
ncbi:hypothetical protein SDC9_203852 [bioreactor metagenome]|uniref:Uncharacterized protein n=1 Tax=bioreactor metagenome TaxID=1076179 RepID=A0A645IY94_9ZZZZ